MAIDINNEKNYEKEIRASITLKAKKNGKDGTKSVEIQEKE